MDSHVLLICRMTEAVTHYGESIKAIMNEELGDGIMSAIDMYATVRAQRNSTASWLCLLTSDMSNFWQSALLAVIADVSFVPVRHQICLHAQQVCTFWGTGPLLLMCQLNYSC